MKHEGKRVKRRKHAQAAMEFLTTYGWALLMVLVAIGVLGWFVAVPTPTEYCLLPPELSCTQFAAYLDDSGFDLFLTVQNNLQNPIKMNLITEIVPTGERPGGDTCWTQPIRVLPPFKIASDGMQNIKCANHGTWPPPAAVGDVVKFKITGHYNESGKIYPHTFEGEALVIVQEGSPPGCGWNAKVC